MALDIASLYVENANLLGVPIALMLSYMIVGLAYMVSKIFSSPQAEQWSKVELSEAFTTTIYAASILALVGVFDVAMDEFQSLGIIVSPSSIGTVVSNMISICIDAIMTIAGFHSYLNVTSWLSYSPGISTDTFLGLVKLYMNYMYSPFSLFAYVLDPFSMLQTVAIGGLAAIIGQYVIYVMIKDFFLGYFLPFSLALRAFPITRNLGSTLLSITVGAYFFYPLSMGLLAASVCSLSYNSPDMSVLTFIGESANALIMSVIEFFKKILSMMIFPIYIWHLMDSMVHSACGDWSNYLCSPFVVAVVLAIWPFVLYIDLLFTAISMLLSFVSFIGAFLVSLGILLGDPTYYANMVSDAILDHIAGYSVLYAYAFFSPIFSFMFTLLGIRTMLTLFGGDEIIVNMLSFL